MKRLSLALAAVAAIMPLTMSAARDNRNDHGVVSIVNSDTVNVLRVEKHLKDNALQAPNEAGLPRFAIVGKDHKFYIGLGAQFLGEAVFDFGDKMSSPTLFTPSAISPSTPGNRSSLGFGWQTSSIYLNVVAMPGSADQLGLFFKANFMGNNNAFNCYHFYVKYRGLSAGYTTSLFADAAAEPMTIDFEGPNGYPYITMFNAYWTQKFTEHFSAAAGIDAPTASLTSGGKTEWVNQRIPAIPLFVQYAWNGGASHLRLSGLVRPMQYRNLEKSENSVLTGLGVQLSGMTNVVGPLSVSYNATYGRGIGTYLQDDNGLGLDAVNTRTAGEMDMVKSLGVTAGLNYVFCPKLSGNLVYSHLTNWLPEEAVVDHSKYRYGDYVAANLIYTVNRFLAAGLEYDYGHRKSFNDASLHTNRLQLQLSVTF